MLHGLYISAAGLKVAQLQQDVLANNLANVNTSGFKPDRVVVESVPPAAALGVAGQAGRSGFIPELALLGGGLRASGTMTDFSAGPVEATGQPLDIALDTGGQADGFLAVRGADGKVCWTRDGRLALADDGQLVTQTGRLAVLGDDGQPIRLDPAAGPINFDGSGRIRQNNNEAASLKLATFSQPDRLVKLGSGQFAAGAGAGAGEFRGRVLQGFVEGSASEPISGLVAMMEVQRAYEANANMIRYQDQTLGLAVNEIARIA